MGSRFGALAEDEYDKIAPAIACSCTLPALTDRHQQRETPFRTDRKNFRTNSSRTSTGHGTGAHVWH